MQADNNILLFGQWYRKKHNVQVSFASIVGLFCLYSRSLLTPPHSQSTQGEEPAPRKPEMSDLRAFVLDRNAYWGDEIALRSLLPL
jgi:hypothetical protein